MHIYLIILLLFFGHCLNFNIGDCGVDLRETFWRSLKGPNLLWGSFDK